MKKIAVKILALSFIIVATISIMYYAKGYRINLEDQKIIKTGVLSIAAQPSKANFYLTEDFQGRTSRAMSSIPAGNYTLNIWLEEYHDLTYEIEILAERSLPLSAFMFKKTPDLEIIHSLETKLTLLHRNGEFAFFIAETDTDETVDYEIIRYKTQTRFWEINNKPEVLFEFSGNIDEKVKSFSVSPSNDFAILNFDDIYLISLEDGEILTTLENNEHNWVKNGLALLWQDENDLVKLNLRDYDNPVTIYDIPSDSKLIAFNSTNDGDIYILQETDKIFNISKIEKSGATTMVIENIYYQNEERFLESWKEKDFVPHQTFKNSPQSTLFIGEPTDFEICLESQSIILTTSKAIYRYDTDENRYTLINPYPSKLLDFSPDYRKLTFLDLERNRLGTFIFNRETANYSVVLGTYYSANDIKTDVCTDYLWHRNSENIFYVCENTLYATDIKGFNNLKLISPFSEYVFIADDKKVLSFQEEDNELNIVEVTIN